MDLSNRPKAKESKEKLPRKVVLYINIGRTRDSLDLLSLGKSIEKILQRYPV